MKKNFFIICLLKTFFLQYFHLKNVASFCALNEANFFILCSMVQLVNELENTVYERHFKCIMASADNIYFQLAYYNTSLYLWTLFNSIGLLQSNQPHSQTQLIFIFIFKWCLSWTLWIFKIGQAEITRNASAPETIVIFNIFF